MSPLETLWFSALPKTASYKHEMAELISEAVFVEVVDKMMDDRGSDSC